MKKQLLTIVAVALSSVAMNAQALLITAGVTPELLSGDDNSQSAIETIIQAFYGPVVDLYKQDLGVGESGDFAGSYATSFGDPALLDEDFTITFTGGTPISSTPVYLLVKDGNASPNWYLYNITPWNGTEVIQGQGFFPAQGGISHVSIYGNHANVPDGGATIALLGLGLFGLGFVARRKAW